MEYAVIRYMRNKQPEQWIIPLDDLKDYLYTHDDGNHKIIIPVIISKQGQICNLLFVFTHTAITTASGFVTQSAYLVFKPSIQPSDIALDQLSTQWHSWSCAQRIDPEVQILESLHRP